MADIENNPENNTNNVENDVKILVVSNGVSNEVKSITLSDDVKLSDEQYTNIIQSISNIRSDGVVSITDNQFDDLVDHIDKVNSTVKSSSDAATVVPSDYYIVSCDLSMQSVFYLSLLFGLILSFVFFFGVTK